MKALYVGAMMMLANAAAAHDSFMPHSHPHGVSFLPSVETLGVAGGHRLHATPPRVTR